MMNEDVEKKDLAGFVVSHRWLAHRWQLYPGALDGRS